MKSTQQLHDLGQSLWLDNITRTLLADGTLRRYIADLSVTGLTSNPTIFDEAIKNGSAYDDAIARKTAAGGSGEALFFELAIEDLTQAADLFRPIHDATGGIDGWVSLEVSPLLANDTAGTVKAAAQLHARAQRPNLFIKIPGHPRRHLRDRGVDLRRRAGERDAAVLDARSTSRRRRPTCAASSGASRAGPDPHVGFGGIAVRQPLGCRREGQGSRGAAQPPGHRRSRSRPTRPTASCWRRRAGASSRPPARAPQRLLWASTGTKDPAAPDTLYVEALAAPDTDQHHAGENPARLRRSRPSCKASCR